MATRIACNKPLRTCAPAQGGEGALVRQGLLQGLRHGASWHRACPVHLMPLGRAWTYHPIEQEGCTAATRRSNSGAGSWQLRFGNHTGSSKEHNDNQDSIHTHQSWPA